MTIWYHPENRPYRFWEIKRVDPNKGTLAFQKDIKKPWGFHRVTLELEGMKDGGLAILTQGWVNPQTDSLSEETGTETRGFTRTEYTVPRDRPLIFGGRQKDDIPVIAVARWMLIVDLFKTTGWK